MRVYQLAKKLGIDNKKLLQILKDYNLPVKSHMSVLDEETAQIVEHEIEEKLTKEKAHEEKQFLESLNKIEIEFPVSVRDFSTKIGVKVSELLKKLIQSGKMININQNVDVELARKIAMDYGYLIEEKKPEEEVLFRVDLEGKDLKKRPPVVTLMGHIDHGKTSLLDRIRNSRITQREAGGITQHIGAYQVDTSHGRITFVDTPGHETFTMMRARGAQVTDIVILVIAADESVMPQTVEAADHAKEAKVPIIVAVNKIDLADTDMDTVKRDLGKMELTPEDWGGKTVCVKVSAKTGEGIDELLEMIILQSEMMDLKADYDRDAVGVVVESRISKQKGPLSTLLVQHGILKKGDFVVCGEFYGKVRNLWDDLGNSIEKAGPSFPAEVLGLNGPPEAGDKFYVVDGEETARRIAQSRKDQQTAEKMKTQTVSLEDVLQRNSKQEDKELKVILKADTFGTSEAVVASLQKLDVENVKIKIIHCGVGAANVSDVMLAEASGAIIVCFNTTVDSQAKQMAHSKSIDVRIYNVIYELINEIKQALEGLIAPQVRRVFLGRVAVKKVFKLSKAGIIAGSMVEQGLVRRGARAELIRDGNIIYRGKVQTLKRFKDDAKEVQQGYECGISLGYNDVKEGDFIDVYTEEIEKRSG